MRPSYPWMAKSPCWECTDRHENCHGNCERYLSYRKEIDEEKQKKAQSKRAGNDVDDILIQGMLKTTKRKNKR